MNSLRRQRIIIPAGASKLPAELTIPPDASAIIVFCRAGANCRHNDQDKVIADGLHQAGLGTLLADLLTETEVLAAREFDIDLVTERLLEVTRWLRHADRSGRYRLGYYAVTVGAAAALKAAVSLEGAIGGIVCLSGRPDLVLPVIPEVSSPILFIAGSLDRYVLSLNRGALEGFSCVRKIAIVQGASHSFAGESIHEVVRLAEAWFNQYLAATPVLNQR